MSPLLAVPLPHSYGHSEISDLASPARFRMGDNRGRFLAPPAEADAAAIERSGPSRWWPCVELWCWIEVVSEMRDRGTARRAPCGGGEDFDTLGLCWLLSGDPWVAQCYTSCMY